MQGYLNHYEIVALGIHEGIIDRELYRKWIAGPLVRDWNAAAPFIQMEWWKKQPNTGEWQYYDKLFCELQTLALSFDKDALDLNAASGGKPENPEGVANIPYKIDDAKRLTASSTPTARIDNADG